MNHRLALLAALAAVAVPEAALAQNPRGKAEASFAGKAVTIDYGRPSLRGRDMLGKAVVGQAWRMGADGPTTLATDVDLTFGSAKVPKGSYLLSATKVSDTEWRLDVKDSSGTAVAQIPLATATAPESVEMFTIELSGQKDAGEFAMTWGTTTLKASFKAK
jgi:hypothetical protein